MLIASSSCVQALLRHRLATTFRFVRNASSKGGSSSRYIARQKRDPFVKARERSGEERGVSYVSRSSFKLEQLNAAHRFLRRGQVVIDLGAAPGGWTQVALRAGCRHVFALDLLPLHASVAQQARTATRATGGPPLTILQGDFRTESMQQDLHRSITEVFGSEDERGVDVIMSDMMANTSGNRLRDSMASLDLLEAALSFARRVLRVSQASTSTETAVSRSPSVLVMKYFDSPEAQEFRNSQLQPLFDRVVSKKVAASRSESSEMYFVCINMKRQLNSPS